MDDLSLDDIDALLSEPDTKVTKKPPLPRIPKEPPNKHVKWTETKGFCTHSQKGTLVDEEFICKTVSFILVDGKYLCMTHAFQAVCKMVKDLEDERSPT